MAEKKNDVKVIGRETNSNGTTITMTVTPKKK